ncbi:LytR C-terminal domain-containing protein [Corynebacterium sp. sy039]|uniref:LytR C-terminal domain-containing protein n=1 Tax=Corynebacterium sp. sy039 TaxID=2599641 RepID=UPI0011B646E1|nr:LytR C-terminal domain-containing protein [Corynebacterium sp. sy039]QDZ41886.1 LytR family transcriptional regulator [Corynebacterium sp. sy039]
MSVNERQENTQGAPLRAMAMILITVAIVLAAWGVYSLVNKKSDDSAGDVNAQEQLASYAAQQSQAAIARAQQQAQQQAAGAAAQTPEPAPVPETQEPTPPLAASAVESTPEQTPKKEKIDRTKDAKDMRLYIYNNSTESGLAARTKDKLSAEGWTVGASGNYQEPIHAQTTVYFTPGNEAEETAARELATRLGGIAAPRNDTLPAESNQNNSVVIVLTQNTTL